MAMQGRVKLELDGLFVSSFEEESVIDDHLMTHVVGNPIHAFQLFKRTVLELDGILRILQESTGGTKVFTTNLCERISGGSILSHAVLQHHISYTLIIPL